MVRTVFCGRFETIYDPADTTVTAKPMPKQNARRSGGGAVAPRRGAYVHLTLYKENKDTMDAVNNLARMLKVRSSDFGFAGTKDRRAATTQRVSVRWDRGLEGLHGINARNPQIKVGDFSFQPAPMQLGQHGGNEFVITLKNVELARDQQQAHSPIAYRLQAAEQCVQNALDHILEHGFLNYYGLQRFGTHTIGTQEIGKQILAGDFQGAVDSILHVDSEVLLAGSDDERFHEDDIRRAKAIALFKSSNDAEGALKVLPKRYNAEYTLISHLGRKEFKADFCSALLRITRGLRNLYIHAYQSYIWNFVASKRWELFGAKVVPGDLVLETAEADPLQLRDAGETDEDPNQEAEDFYQRARALTAEDVASGKYTVFDVVLPVPGYAIVYPDNEIGTFYEEFMGREENGGMNPYYMQRTQREFSLSGYYRKFVAKLSTVPRFFVCAYADDLEQMHATDLDRIHMASKTRDLQHGEIPAGRQHIRGPHARAGAAARLKEAQVVKQDEAVQRAASRWTHFADNAKTFDEAAIASNQRLAALQPQDSERRITDNWRPTDVDGANKRVKVEAADEDKTVTHSADALNAKEATPEFADHTMAEVKPEAESGARLTDTHPMRSVPGFDGADATKGNSSDGPADTNDRSGKRGFTTRHSTTPEKPRQRFPVDFYRGDAGTAEGSKAISLTDHELQNDSKAAQRIAVVLNFRLGSSSYATICLRELMSSAAGAMKAISKA